MDTDLGFDCDDAGAIALADILHNNGKISLLAVTHSVNRQIGGAAIKCIDRYYGNPSVPVGIAGRYAIDADRFYEEFYAKFRYADSFSGWKEKPSFYKLFEGLKKEESEHGFSSAVDVTADALFGCEDDSVTFVCIGQANNVADMLEEVPLGRYGMTRRELFLKKVRNIVIMCGNFMEYEKEYLLGDLYWKGEFNVLLDIASAKKLFSYTDFPIYVLDFNQGADVLAGSGLREQTDNPVRKMYLAHGDGKRLDLPAWDIMTVMFASGVFDEMFTVGESGTVTIDDNGKSVFRTGAGSHRLIRRKAAADEFSAVINEVLRCGHLK